MVVPGFSADAYRTVVEFAGRTPEPVQWFAAHFTEASIVLLGLLLVATVWHRLDLGGQGRWGLRDPDWRRLRPPWPSHRTPALFAPVAVVVGYGCSEWIKVSFDAERPCRAFSELAIIAAECPPVGDWSFPSNHSTIAGGIAAAIVLLTRRLGLVAVPLAALSAFSRTFVGVHYPHDVAIGLLLGAVVTTVLTLLLTWLARRVAPAREPVPH